MWGAPPRGEQPQAGAQLLERRYPWRTERPGARPEAREWREATQAKYGEREYIAAADRSNVAEVIMSNVADLLTEAMLQAKFVRFSGHAWDGLVLARLDG